MENLQNMIQNKIIIHILSYTKNDLNAIPFLSQTHQENEMKEVNCESSLAN